MKNIRAEAPVYNIVKNIGQGLSSDVYLAIRQDAQKHSRQKVVLKVLKSETHVHWLRSEFLALQSVQHQNCVRAIAWENLSVGQTLVLEHIDGETLWDLREKIDTFTWSELVEIVSQIQAGLKALHEKGLVHGDLSPKNVMLDRSGQIKIIDFGASLSTDLMTTPHFSAPETLAHGHRSASSDLWSLGRILEFFEMRTGRELAPESMRNWRAELLSDDPKHRSFLNVNSRADQKNSLSMKMRKLIVADCSLDDFSTRAYDAVTITDLETLEVGAPESPTDSKSLSKWKSAVLVGCFLLVSNGDVHSGLRSPMHFNEIMYVDQEVQKAVDEKTAVIEIRSLRWVRVRLSGGNWEYAPFRFSGLAAGKMNVEFETQAGRGMLELKLKSGEYRLLKSEDFMSRAGGNSHKLKNRNRRE